MAPNQEGPCETKHNDRNVETSGIEFSSQFGPSWRTELDPDQLPCVYILVLIAAVGFEVWGIKKRALKLVQYKGV